MPALGDILQVIDEQELAGQTILNVWYFELQDDEVGYDNIAVGIKVNIVDKACNIQTTSLEHVKLTIKNLTDQVGLYEETYSTPYTGLRAGEYLPTFNAWAFRLNRTNRSTRNGQKRIAGVAEADVQGNEPVPAFVGALDLAATQFGSSFTYTGAKELSPVIVRLGPGSVVTAAQPVLNATFSRVSSQVSRKA